MNRPSPSRPLSALCALACLLILPARLAAQTPTPPPERDTEPLLAFTIQVPDDITVPSCDGGPVPVAYPAPNVLSRCPSASPVFCDPPSGSLLRPGAHPVTCWSTNACGDAATNVFVITVVHDTAPPQIVCPDPIVAYATDTNGVVIHYPLPAVTDDGDPAPQLICTPPPGSTFPLGLTTITCVATDACGRSNSCSFTIEVRAPVVRIATLPDPAGGGAPLVSVSAEGFDALDMTTDLNGEWTPLATPVLAESPAPGTNKFFRPGTMEGVKRGPDQEIAYVAVGPLSAPFHPYPAGRQPVFSFAQQDLQAATNGVKVLSGNSGGAGNLWSEPLTLPFHFYLYGRPYKQFRVSKNGLLTFSTNLTSNTQGLGYFNFLPAQTTNLLVDTLPLWTNGFAVDNTIFALAGRHVPQSAQDGVYARTTGKAPNRTVWIFFHHPKDIFGETLTAIALHEGLNWIHIVDLHAATNAQPWRNTTSRLLCGVQGAANSEREVRQIAASPYMTLVSTNTEPWDNAAYLFRPYPLGHQITGQASLQLMAATNLDLFITEQARRLNIPGMTVAISRNGRLIFNKAYGYRMVEQSQLMQPYHRACIGSVSKMFAAYGIEMLIQDGVLSGLNEPAYAPNRLGQPWFWTEVNVGISNNIFTNFWATPGGYLNTLSNITIRRLLSHTAALNNVNNDTAVANLYQGGNYLAVTPRNHVQWHIRTQPLITNGVGLVAAYSNPSFKQLGVLIEELAGQPYESWMHSRLLAPAGVLQLRLMRIYEWDQTWRDARRYLKYEPIPVPTPTNTWLITGSPWANSRISGGFGPVEYGDAAYANAADGAAGSYTATAEDLVRFMAAVDGLPNRPDILPPARFNELETAVLGNQGVGWDSVTGVRVWKNGGIGYGGAHLVRSRSPDRLTVAVVANNGENVTPLGNAIWNAVLPVPPIAPNYDLFGVQLQAP